MSCKCTRCGRPVAGPHKVEAVDGFVGKIRFRDHRMAANWFSEIPSVNAIEYERQYQAMRDRVYRDIELRDRVYWEHSREPSAIDVEYERRRYEAARDRIRDTLVREGVMPVGPT